MKGIFLTVFTMLVLAFMWAPPSLASPDLQSYTLEEALTFDLEEFAAISTVSYTHERQHYRISQTNFVLDTITGVSITPRSAWTENGPHNRLIASSVSEVTWRSLIAETGLSPR